MIKILFAITTVIGLTLFPASASLQKKDAILEKAIDKLHQNVNISYDYLTKTDNYFNSTFTVDSGSLTRFRSAGGLHKFGFCAKQKQVAYLFDGIHFSKYKHEEKVKVVFDEGEIQSNESYFENFIFWSQSPFQLANMEGLVKLEDKFVEDRKFHVFLKEQMRPSMSDSTQIIKYQGFWFIEEESNEVSMIRNITILENDTLQKVEQLFNNFAFGNYNKTTIKGLEDLNYDVVLAENEYPELEITPIRIGQKVKSNKYVNIHNEETIIYGEDGKSSLIVFGYIGCFACEKAIKDLLMIYPNLKKDINVFYSSFQNKNFAVGKYIQRKKLPFVAFGSESNMMVDFQLYTSPSFIFIDEKGFVTYIEEGYNQEVKAKLMDILLIK
ncbi:MAG TPA: hypothetical protein VK169_07465 [Saprospiraceae bacterium]|nr:hypothetical protein [Saprospiraceae bacterium]